jgi:hypothetical protein
MDGSSCLGSDYGLSPGEVTAFRIARFSWEHVLVSGVLLNRMYGGLIIRRRFNTKQSNFQFAVSKKPWRLAALLIHIKI